jgi:hypothetical protein
MSGPSSPPLRRWSAVARRTSGAALGSIIAAIITHHMRRIRAAWDGDQGAGLMAAAPIASVMAMPPPGGIGMPMPASVQAQAEMATRARPAATTSRSRRSVVSITDARPMSAASARARRRSRSYRRVQARRGRLSLPRGRPSTAFLAPPVGHSPEVRYALLIISAGNDH